MLSPLTIIGADTTRCDKRSFLRPSGTRHRGDGGIVEALRADVASGAEGAERSDDITILVQEYLRKR